MLKVSVCDTGMGIEQQNLQELFKMFSKGHFAPNEDGDGVTRGNEEGYGVGLNICKSLVEMSGGEINVSSEGLNQGSVFTFTMKMES